MQTNDIPQELLNETIPASEFIRRGIPLCKDAIQFRPCVDGTCAIGTGLIGKYGVEKAIAKWAFARESAANHLSPEETYGALLNLPPHIASRLSRNHSCFGMSREDCADWLQAQGY